MGYLAAWCAAEYAFVSIPDAAVPESGDVEDRQAPVRRRAAQGGRAHHDGWDSLGCLAYWPCVGSGDVADENGARVSNGERDRGGDPREAGGTGLPPDFVRLETGARSAA